MKYNLSFVNYQELSFIHLVWAQPKTNLFLRMQKVCEAQVSRYVVKSKCRTLQIVRQERKKLHSAGHQTELGPTFLFIVFTIGNCHYLPLISQLQHGAQNLSWQWWGRNPPWLTKVIDILLTVRTSGIIPPPPFTKAFSLVACLWFWNFMQHNHQKIYSFNGIIITNYFKWMLPVLKGQFYNLPPILQLLKWVHPIFRQQQAV